MIGKIVEIWWYLFTGMFHVQSNEPMMQPALILLFLSGALCAFLLVGLFSVVSSLIHKIKDRSN